MMNEKLVNTRYYVYLASCANGTLYVGYTKNVQERLARHNSGRGGRFTRINRPVILVAYWLCDSRIEAIKTEQRLKRLSPENKMREATQNADYFNP